MMNASFDSVSGGGRRAHNNSRPTSDAYERLDENVRMMMQTADLNGGNGTYDDDDDVVSVECKSMSVEKSGSHSTKRYSSHSYTVASSNSLKKKASQSRQQQSNNGLLTSSSVQEVSKQKMVISKGDVVRIHVPYQPDDVVTVVNNAAGDSGRGSGNSKSIND